MIKPNMATMTTALPNSFSHSFSKVTSLSQIHALAKRAASSSMTSTSSGKSAKCTGSKQECQKPSNTSAVTVGVAVGIPVGCVCILLGIILWVVYRRSKKEAQEDNDPDFEGDTEYLSSDAAYKLPFSSVSHSGNSRTPQEWKEDGDTYFPPPQGNMYYGNDSSRSSQGKNLDPFFEPANDAHSLRDFARQLHGEKFGAYRIASNPNSRNESQLSLPFEKAQARISEKNSASLNASDLGHVYSSNTQLSSSSQSPLQESPVKSTAGDVTKQYVEDNSGFDVEHSRADTTLEYDLPQLKEPSEISRNTFNFEMGNVNEYETNGGESSGFNDSGFNDSGNDDGENRVIQMSTAEEEDIKRMKSIYKVYLDRNATVKQVAADQNDVVALPDQANEPGELLPTQNHVSTENVSYMQVPTSSQRVASSIYSATHSQLYPEQPVQGHQYQQQQQQPYTTYEPQTYGPPSHDNTIHDNRMLYQQQPHQEYGDMSMQSYPTQEYHNMPPQQYMGQNYIQQQQFAHPQTLESIDELPPPIMLPNSASSHSLTSFKQKAKHPQLTQLQAARINGMAVNPISHPEMFYAQGNDSYSSYQKSINGASNVQPAAPYQLRQSVVMTNPTDLVAAPRFRPAGSIRNVSAASSRNNSMTTNMNPQYQQQQAYNSRVSGLLNESDLVHPPSVGGILPHNGSNDDLRKQIGSSHNYSFV